MAASSSRDLFLQVGGTVAPLQAALKIGAGALLEFNGSVTDTVAEVNRRFGEMGSNPAPARSLVSNFRSAFSEIQQQAKDALTLPASKSGSLNLDVKSASAAASAATAQATALREIADAATRASEAAGVENEQLRLFAIAAAASAAQSEQYAGALRQQADTVEAVQAELNAAGATAARTGDVVTGAHGRMSASSMIMQHVVRSTTDSFAAGLPVTMIFGEQISRLGEAAALASQEGGNAEGAFGKFAAFMASGWGIALNIGIAVAASLASHLLSGGDAAEKTAEAHKKLTDAIHDSWVESEKALQTADQTRAADIAEAETKLRKTIAIRQATQALIDHAAAQVKAAQVTENAGNGGLPGTVGGAAGIAGANAQRTLDGLGKQSADESQAVIEAWEAINNLRIPALQQRVADATDDSAAATDRYKKTLGDLNDKLKLHLISEGEYLQQLKAATELRDQTTDHHAAPRSTLNEEDQMAAARAKLATATTDVEKAEAALDIIRANRKNLTPQEYENELIGATQALNLAKLIQQTKEQLAATVSQTAKPINSIFAAQNQDAINDVRGANTARYNASQDQEQLQSPLYQYRAQLADATGDMNKAMQNVEVDGLKGLEDGLVGIITGTKSVAQAFKEMATSIIADIAKIAIEKAIVSFIPGLGKADGGLIAPLKRAGGGIIPAFADGGANGLFAGIGGPRDDKNLVWLSNGEFVTNAAATKRFLPLLKAINDNSLPAFADGGLNGMSSGVSLRSLTPADIRASSQPAITVHMGGTQLNAPGADPAQLARLEAAFNQSQRELPARVVSAVTDAKSRLMMRGN